VQATDKAGNLSAWVESNQATVTSVGVRKYYKFASQVVAERSGSNLYYLNSDHLSSTSLATSQSGQVVFQARYEPYGQMRWSSGQQTTDKTFTGQRMDASFGLMNYNARYYDPALGRFISPDTLIPDSRNAKAFDRYGYANNNPLRYTDPTGHCAILCVFVIFAVAAMTVPWLSGDTPERTTPVSQEQFNTELKQRADLSVAIVSAGMLASTTVAIASETAGFTGSTTINAGTSRSGNISSSETELLTGPKPFGNMSQGGAASAKSGLETLSSEPIYCRYCSNAEVDAIKSTGLLRGGRPDNTYFTTDMYSTVQEAQQSLSLPFPPEARVEFTINNSPQIYGPSKVFPANGQPGGGIEYWSSDPIQVIVHSIQELIKR
jgi:RHS repeat-associated protein